MDSDARPTSGPCCRAVGSTSRRPSGCGRSSASSCGTRRANGPDNRSSCSTGSGQEIVAPLFGWKRPDGTRRFRRGYIEVPKKNGKSCLFSGLSLYLLIGDGEPGAEIYSAAVDRDQASIVFNEAANMVEASPHSVVAAAAWSVPPSGSSITAAGRSTRRSRPTCRPRKGLNAHAVLIDELHAQKTRDLWDTLRYAGASRRQPLHLTHHHRRLRPAFDLLGTARLRPARCWTGRSRTCRSSATSRPQADEDDWTDPEVWQKANPSFGITIDAEQFAEDCREAQESPAKENSFRRYRLNQWTEQDVRWLNMEKWDACGASTSRIWKGKTATPAWTSPARPTSRRWCWCFPDEERYRRAALLLGAGGRGPAAGTARPGAVLPVDSTRDTSRPRRAKSIDYDRIRTADQRAGRAVTTSARSASTAGTPRSWPRSSTGTGSRWSPSGRATPA